MWKTLEISTRQRAFEVGNVRDDRNQCLDRGERIIDYNVTISGDPKHLTPEGFVLNRNEIPQYFHRKWGGTVDVLPSCEEMAMLAAKDLAELCGEAALRVTVNVGGATAVWEKEVADVQSIAVTTDSQ